MWVDEKQKVREQENNGGRKRLREIRGQMKIMAEEQESLEVIMFHFIVYKIIKL